MAAFVWDWLEEAGLQPQKQEVEPGRENVLAFAEGADASKALLLCSHTDTVGVADMVIDPFDPVVRDGKLYGRGACDTKASLAAMMIAFRDRAGAGNLPANLVLLASCGEEYNLMGVKHYARQAGSRLSGAIFGEPTQLQVITAHKGVARYRIICRGRSGHSSQPRQADNAIYAMSKVLPLVERFARDVETRPPHPQLGAETLAVTLISGGHQVNVIPDRCEASIDWRVLPGRRTDDCRHELAQALKDKLHELDLPSTSATHAPEKIEIEPVSEYAPMETDPDHPMSQALLAATDGLATKPGMAVAHFATDASAFVAFDIPTLVLGPGNIAQAHTKDEHIQVEQLEKGLAVHQRFLAANWGI